MDKSAWAAFRAALKTLDASPKKIAEARATYAEADKWMQEHKRNYSEIGQENYYNAAKTKRDNTINGEVAKIGKALECVREYRRFPGEKIDLSDAKLQAALNIVNLMGSKLPHAQQISIIQDFQGKPAELNFLADVFDSQKLYYGSYARELAKPVSEEALQNLEYCVNAYELLGKWDFDTKCYWTQNEWAQAAERYGFDVNDGKDAYVEALKAAREGKSPEEQRILSSAISEILKNQEFMSDAQRAEIFNNATDRCAQVREAAEANEIQRQAITQQGIDLAQATIEGGNSNE